MVLTEEVEEDQRATPHFPATVHHVQYLAPLSIE